MGSDDLFKKKRKARNTKELKRQKDRKSYKRILIVCEGEKTEPNYFIGIRSYYRLHTANIEISGDKCGSDPKSIVKYAKQRFGEEKNIGNAFDEVYCVFDKDRHTNYQEAINELKNSRDKNIFHAITSVPCFEYWLLLHFEYTTKPFSTPAEVINHLKQYLPDYEKGKCDILKDLSDLDNQLARAIATAERALIETEQSNTDNPSTQVHTLVKRLKNLNEQ